MSEFGQWIDSRGATLERLREHGRLWVFDRSPPTGKGVLAWIATAEPKDTALKIQDKWMRAVGLEVPRSVVARGNLFERAVRDSCALALVLEDAHLLRGQVLRRLRLFAEMPGRPTVVLVGDTAVIRAATREYKDFSGRAAYAVRVDRLFEAA